MSHPELVQVATDLISESQQPTLWLPSYDSALTGSDSELETLTERLRQELQASIQLAA